MELFVGILWLQHLMGILVANFMKLESQWTTFFCCRIMEVSHRTGGQFYSLWKAVVPEKFCFDVSNGAPFQIP